MDRSRDEGLPPERQSWYLHALAHPEAGTPLTAVVAGMASLNARIAPTLPIFATLAKEPQGDIYRASQRLRRDGMERLAEVACTPTTRSGLTSERAADILDS